MNLNAGKSQNVRNDKDNAGTSNEKIMEIIPGFKTFDDFLKSSFEVVKNGVKASNGLPRGNNFDYYSCFPGFTKARSMEMDKISNKIQRVLNLAGITESVSRRDAEEKFELLAEANDAFLDRANTHMDTECGIRRELAPKLIVAQVEMSRNINGSWNRSNNAESSSQTTTDTRSVRLLMAKNVPRPQLMFKDQIDNSHKPWEPRIKYKHNMLKPLALYLEQDEDREIFNHPYEFELDKFQPPEKQLVKRKPMKYKSLEQTPMIIIEKVDDMKILLEDLRNYDEVAVDLEHHNYRTFQGITCLMQISTRDTDYIIDTLTLRSELHELNEIFTKPSVLKVFHGAESDVEWLQRDLSLYIVNMFDTHKACKQLSLQHESLAFLLKTYCDVNPDKSFQLVDWRIRPLTEEHFKYAREDTHYLLYIKDVLRNALIDQANGQKNILKAVYDRSTDVCRIRYEKSIWHEDSYMMLYRRSKKMFNNRQLYALKELHKWRDATAREEDDSTSFVMPNHVMINIAQTLPKEMQGILACCGQIPPLVRQNLLELHKMVLKAISQPLIKPILEEEERQRMTQRSLDVDTEIWNYSPHDMPSDMEPRADLPCLLDQNGKKEKKSRKRIGTEHMITVWDSLSSEDESSESAKVTKKKIFLSPYERYRRVIPMVVELEARERARQEKQEEERVKKIEMEQQKTQESIGRVYKHFNIVAQKLEKANVTKLPVKVPLAQMPGRKRKRQMSDSGDEIEEKPEGNYLPREEPELPKKNQMPDRENAKKKQKNRFKIRPTMKKEKPAIKENPEVNYLPREEPEPPEKNQMPDRENAKKKQKNQFNIRPTMKKGDKKGFRQDMKSKGLLPAEKFNYKSVDFSSFQGGSKHGNSQTSFQQKTPKDKVNKKKHKKRKIAGI